MGNRRREGKKGRGRGKGISYCHSQVRVNAERLNQSKQRRTQHLCHLWYMKLSAHRDVSIHIPAGACVVCEVY